MRANSSLQERPDEHNWHRDEKRVRKESELAVTKELSRHIAENEYVDNSAIALRPVKDQRHTEKERSKR
jgi:hypothetical protein